MESDIDRLPGIAQELLSIPVESDDFSDEKKCNVKEHIAYQKTLRSISMKVIVLKKSPYLLYLGSDEQCLYNNNAELRLITLRNAILQRKTSKKVATSLQAAIASYKYCKSFLEGINAGLSFHLNALGRICSVKKLCAFIKYLPVELDLLQQNTDDRSKVHNEELVKALQYSPNLIDNLRKIVKDLHQIDQPLSLL